MPPSLPTTPFTLRGSCNCRSNTYTLTIPSLSDRPFWASPHDPTSDGAAIRCPFICTCHCDSCRRATGQLPFLVILVSRDMFRISCLKRPGSTARGSDHPSISDPHTLVSASHALVDESAEQDPSLRLSFDGHTSLTPTAESLGTYLVHFRSSERAYRTFCGRCGTPLTYGCSVWPKELDFLPRTVDVSVPTLEREDLVRLGDGLAPERHLWWESGVEWVKKRCVLSDGGEGLPRHPGVDVREGL